MVLRLSTSLVVNSILIYLLVFIPFQVVAFVVVNGQQIFDLTPETFAWTIVPIVVETILDSAD